MQPADKENSREIKERKEKGNYDNSLLYEVQEEEGNAESATCDHEEQAQSTKGQMPDLRNGYV
jgi:hypothetical protein